MSRRRQRDDEPVLSLDSFLDIVTNVVGVLILVAVVTVLGAGDIGVSAGASALAAPRPSAERVLFECAGEELFFVDEAGNAKRVRDAVAFARDTFQHGPREQSVSALDIVGLLDTTDVGDRSHRVRAQIVSDVGITWVYGLRDGARGERAETLERRASAFQRRLDELPAGGFAYFVVHDDSFELFRRAREIARARGIAVGWHPVEGKEPVRLSGAGSLGKRIQ